MTRYVGPIYAHDDYAGFVRRTAALAIDAIILTVAWFVLAWGWYYFAPDSWVTRASYVWIYALWGLGSPLYLVGFRLTTAGTLGYRIVGIKYAHMLSSEPSRTSLAFRAVMALFLLWFFALDHLWIPSS